MITNVLQNIEISIEQSIRKLAYEYAQEVITRALKSKRKNQDYDQLLNDLLEGKNLIICHTQGLIALSKVYQNLLGKKLDYKALLKCFYLLKYTEIKELEKAELEPFDMEFAHNNQKWPLYHRDIARHYIPQWIACALQLDPVYTATRLSIQVLDSLYSNIERIEGQRHFDSIGMILFGADYVSKVNNDYNRIWQYKPLRDKNDSQA